MNQYLIEVARTEQEKTAGRVLTSEIIKDLSEPLGIPQARYLRFEVNRRGTQPDQERLVDADRKTVAEIPLEWLQDAPSTPETRSKLVARLTTTIISHFHHLIDK